MCTDCHELSNSVHLRASTNRDVSYIQFTIATQQKLSRKNLRTIYGQQHADAQDASGLRRAVRERLAERMPVEFHASELKN